MLSDFAAYGDLMNWLAELIDTCGDFVGYIIGRQFLVFSRHVITLYLEVLATPVHPTVQSDPCLLVFQCLPANQEFL